MKLIRLLLIGGYWKKLLIVYALLAILGLIWVEVIHWDNKTATHLYIWYLAVLAFIATIALR